MSNQPIPLPNANKERRKPARRIVILLVVVLALISAWGYYASQANKQLEEAIAEADRLDPGWRLEELEAKRTVVADDSNSAFVLAGAKKMLSWDWPFGGTSANATDEQLDLAKRIPKELAPPEQLNAQERKLLANELGRAEPARTEVLKVIHLPAGRYPVTYTKDGISTLLPYSQGIRSLVTLLCYEAVFRAEQQHLEGALACCRGIFHVEHSIRDEPTIISMIIRWACQRIALLTLERVLAQGELPAPLLAEMQKLLEEEERDPMLLIALRGSRALTDRAMQAIEIGHVKPSELPAILTTLKQYGGDDFDPYSIKGFPAVFFPGSVKSQRAVLLRWNNRLVEIAKLPVEEQRQALAEMPLPTNDLPILVRALRLPWTRIADNWFRANVSIRCMIALLAVERYRMAHGRWPERLDDLVPEYLPLVPIDVYSNSPLRYHRFSEGVMVYSVGMGSLGNGSPPKGNPKIPGEDRGYCLWDVPRRRQPPKDELKPGQDKQDRQDKSTNGR